MMSLPALVVAGELRQIFLGASQITNLFVFLKSLLLAAHVHSGLFSAAGSFPVLLLLTCSLCSLHGLLSHGIAATFPAQLSCKALAATFALSHHRLREG